MGSSSIDDSFFLSTDFTDLTDFCYAGLGVETTRVRGCFIRVIRVIDRTINMEVKTRDPRPRRIIDNRIY